MQKNFLAFAVAVALSAGIVSAQETPKVFKPDRPAATKEECVKHADWKWSLGKCRRTFGKVMRDIGAQLPQK